MPESQSHSVSRPPQRVVTEFQARRRTLPRWEAANTTYAIRFSVLEGRPERLTDPGIADIVRGSLHHQDGRRYGLHFYTIMSTHIHAVLAPLPRDGGSIPLPEITHALKSYTAHQINKLVGATGSLINKLVGATGSLWLDEGYNRMIRCQEEYWDWYNYIWLNPYKAGLVDDPDQWPFWWEREQAE